MPIRVVCPNCQTSNSVADEQRGKKVRCRECDEPIRVPDDDEEGVFDAKGKSVPPSRRGRSSDDEDEDTPRPAKKGKGGCLLVALLVGGGVAVLGFVAVVLAVVLFFVLGRSDQPQVAENNNAPGMFAPPGIPNPIEMPPVVVPNPNPNPPAVPNPPPVVVPPNPPPMPPNPVVPNPPMPPNPVVPNPPAPPGQIDAATMQKVKAASVYLRVNMPSGGQAEGSGFFAVEPGIVFTNAHVLGMLRAQSNPPTNVEVVLNSGEPGERRLAGKVLGVDRGTDLAVLRVEAAGAPLPAPLAVDSATKLIELQKVYVFGFPFGKQLGRNITISEGAISAIRRDANGTITQVQLNGDMQPGNSGGPVVDAEGRVIGVAVAILKGTRINFAVPADFIGKILAGRLEESRFGLPFLDGNQLKLPVQCDLLDPLGRVQGMRYEVWVGNPGPVRPPADAPPPPAPGDGPITGTGVNLAASRGSTDIPLPALQPGQVYWIRAVVNTAGKDRWLSARPKQPFTDPPLQRVAADLQMKMAEPAERTLKVKDNQSITIYEGKNASKEGQRFEADLLENLVPGEKGTTIRLTVGPNQFHDEFEGKAVVVAPDFSRRIRAFTPSFLADVTGKLQSRSNPNLNPKLAKNDFDNLEAMYYRFCNAIEQTSLYLPNRTVQPLEKWPAKLPTMVGSGRKKKILDIHLECTYLGTRERDQRKEALIGLAGVLKGRDKGKTDSLGQATGRAVVDLDGGYLANVVMKISTELDLGPVQLVIAEDIDVSRTPGNPLNIVPVTPKKAPDPMVAKEKGPEKKPPEPPATTPPATTPPEKKPPETTEKKPAVPAVPAVPALPPVAGKVLLSTPMTLTKAEPFDDVRTGCHARSRGFSLQAGKTYVIDMKQTAGTVDPYLRLLDPSGTQVATAAADGATTARITYTAKQTGIHRIVATTFGAGQTGGFRLTITAKE